MQLYKLQKNKKFAKQNTGFTILEVLVAILILNISIAGFATVVGTSSNSAKYSNNEITANYLLQEATDSIRNSRDSFLFNPDLDTDGNPDYNNAWNNFKNRYGSDSNSKCFSYDGCYLKIENFAPKDTSGSDVVSCDGICPPLKYDIDNDNNSFYLSPDNNSGVESNFTRTIKMSEVNDGDQIKVVVTIKYKNGTIDKTKSLETYLLKWK